MQREAGEVSQGDQYPDLYHGLDYPIVMRTDMKPFDDARVRNALRLVQDRKKIQELVQPQGGLAYDHWIPSSAADYCPSTDANGRPQDIEKAKALLAEAGYPDGLEIELATADDAHRPAFAQVYKEMATRTGQNVCP